ncbi:MAG TPA: hypothetical protein VHH88_05020 [Verrucomicrobiae bacterium]|nr:hypothetical protein [Verrucomicrobiae bacterium]
MKNSPLTTILLTVLAISAIFSVVTCWLYIGKSRELRMLQATVGGVEGNRRTVQALLGEAVEYSKTHPDIQPVLDRAGVKVKPAAGSSTRNSK